MTATPGVLEISLKGLRFVAKAVCFLFLFVGLFVWFALVWCFILFRLFVFSRRTSD